MFRTGNPVLSKSDAFKPAQSWDDLNAQGRGYEAAPPAKAARVSHMTVQGAVNKTFLLLAICMVCAVASWNISLANPGLAFPLAIGSMLVGVVLTMVMCMKPASAVVTAPLLGVSEGFFCGAASLLVISWVPKEQLDGSLTLNTGLIFNAILLTVGITGGMLAGYSTGLVRFGPGMRKFVVTATMGLAVYALLSMVASTLGFFKFATLWDPSNGGLVSVGFSVFVVAIATMNLVLDFEFFQHGAERKAPKSYEWVAAGGLLVTMVWLYIEVLRLLAKLQSRD
ncbi:MAG: Bax inhibitor-1/YccA family protein [Phycisphaerales bacterium]|nr:Bax inhibitor-1/YccA family protein [Phycisphaerales bacterium]